MITRRNFIKGMVMLPIALRMGIIPSYASSDKQSVSELESLLNQEIEEVKQKDKKQFGQDLGWYVQGKDNGSDSKVVLFSDYHNYSNAGFYNSVFNVIKKHLDSVGLESCEAGTKNPKGSILKLKNNIFCPLGSERDSEIHSKLVNTILDSNLKVYGLEKENLHNSHGCVTLTNKFLRLLATNDNASYNQIQKIEGMIDKLYDVANDSRIPKLENFTSAFLDDNKFGEYCSKLDQLDRQLINERSEYVVDVVSNYLEGKSVVTGIIYGASHMDLIKKKFDEKGLSHLYVSSEKIEKIEKIYKKADEIFKEI